MRDPNGPCNAILVVSKPPCPGPLGCDSVLRDLLPAGCTLTIYVLDAEGGVQYYDTYTGTGRGVAS